MADKKYVNEIEIGPVVTEIQGVENGKLVVSVNNTLVCHLAFLATDTQLCVLIPLASFTVNIVFSGPMFSYACSLPEINVTLLVVWVLVICLLCRPSVLEHVDLALWVYTSGKSLMPILQL